MAAMASLKRVLTDPGRHLAQARNHRTLGPILAPFANHEIHALSDSYKRGEVSRQVNDYFGPGGDRSSNNPLSAIIGRIPQSGVAELKADYANCGPGGCAPPGG
jgi:hypothetical protein